MTLRKLALTALASCLLAPMALLAQPPDDPGNGGPERGRGPSLLRQILPPPGYLQLTDAQKENLEGLARDLRDALQPLHAEQQRLGAELRDAFAADDPDPTTIGQLMLDLRALGETSRGEIVAFTEAFREILDADQKVKWDNFLELRALHRRGQGDGGSKALKLRRLFGG